ncbi:MAG: hypothetical protein AAF650_05895 [Pseudomonadota bacterium]
MDEVSVTQADHEAPNWTIVDCDAAVAYYSEEHWKYLTEKERKKAIFAFARYRQASEQSTRAEMEREIAELQKENRLLRQCAQLASGYAHDFVGGEDQQFKKAYLEWRLLTDADFKSKIEALAKAQPGEG